MINVKPTDEERKMSKPQLKLLTGGKEPPSTTGGVNWLNGLARGTAFSCKKRNSDDVFIFVIAFKYERTIVLVDGFHSENRFAVDPEVFSKKHDYWETVGTEEEAQPPKEIEHDSDRTVSHGRVADDVDAEGRQPPVQEDGGGLQPSDTPEH